MTGHVLTERISGLSASHSSIDFLAGSLDPATAPEALSIPPSRVFFRFGQNLHYHFPSLGTECGQDSHDLALLIEALEDGAKPAGMPLHLESIRVMYRGGSPHLIRFNADGTRSASVPLTPDSSLTNPPLWPWPLPVFLAHFVSPRTYFSGAADITVAFSPQSPRVQTSRYDDNGTKQPTQFDAGTFLLIHGGKKYPLYSLSFVCAPDAAAQSPAAPPRYEAQPADSLLSGRTA